MKTKSILTIIILLITIGISAQKKADIQQIRKWYGETKNKIANSQKQKTQTPLLCTVFERNAYKNEGAFHLKQEFWHNFEEMNTQQGLEMVILNAKKSFYAEYLYHKGELVFVFFKDYLNEFRFYFKDDVLIKEVKGTKVGEGMFTMTSEEAKRNASIYMEQYLSGFCTPND